MALGTAARSDQGSMARICALRGRGERGATIIRNTAYDPYGDVINDSGSVTQEYEFVGGYGVRDTSAPSGNYYVMGQRLYDSSTGRFISRDPIGYKGGLNLYGYCENNPLNNVDPSGTLKLPKGGGKACAACAACMAAISADCAISCAKDPEWDSPCDTFGTCFHKCMATLMLTPIVPYVPISASCADVCILCGIAIMLPGK